MNGREAQRRESEASLHRAVSRPHSRHCELHRHLAYGRRAAPEILSMRIEFRYEEVTPAAGYYTLHQERKVYRENEALEQGAIQPRLWVDGKHWWDMSPSGEANVTVTVTTTTTIIPKMS